MGNICSCLCPRRGNKNKTSYDVHQETFEMEENIDSMNIDDHSPTIPKDVNLTDQIQPDERQSTENLIRKSNQGQEEKLRSKEQKKYVETKINLKKQNLGLSEESVSFKLQSEDPLSSKDIKSRDQPFNQQQTLNQPQKANNSQPSFIHPEPVNTQASEQQRLQPAKVQQKPANPNILKPKTVKKKYNPDDYRFKDQQNQFQVKRIDSIKCQQYNIENCKNSQYFIFDVTANVYIDDTNDCKIYIAPCQSTIFVRNCRNLTIVAATKQFRTYECHNCVFSLLCKSQPVIQSSSELVFAPFEINYYTEFAKQLNSVKLDLWNNHWSEIHNFTKKQGQVHHTLKRNLPVENGLNWQRGLMEAQIQPDNAFEVPFIQGEFPLELQNYQKCIILFNKDVSKDDNLILESIKGCRILKSFKGKLAGFGKDDRVALLLAYCQGLQNRETLEEGGQLFTSTQQIDKYEGQFFVSFGDQREK